MNFKLVSMIEKREMVKVSQAEGIIIGVLDRKGLSLFENGEVATTSCRGTFDTKKGFQGYTSMIFEDGSTLVLSWKGPTGQPRPAGGKFREYKLAVEYAVDEGSELEVMNTLQRYTPFVHFKVHPIASVSQVEEMIKALTK